IYAYSSLKEAVWADGIDLDGCKDVHISNSTIETGDDCIIFISSNVWGPALPCENITITNCRLSSASAAIKFSEGNWLVIRNVMACGKGPSMITGQPDSWRDGISHGHIKLFVSADLAAPYDVAVQAIKCRWAQSLKSKGLEVAWGKPVLDKWGRALYFGDV